MHRHIDVAEVAGDLAHQRIVEEGLVVIDDRQHAYGNAEGAHTIDGLDPDVGGLPIPARDVAGCPGCGPGEHGCVIAIDIVVAGPAEDHGGWKEFSTETACRLLRPFQKLVPLGDARPAHLPLRSLRRFA